MGIEDLPRNASLRKPAFTEVEQEQFLQIIKSVLTKNGTICLLGLLILA